MKYLLGIILIVSSINITRAACSSYSTLIAITDASIKNIAVEGYRVFNEQNISLLASSLDYADNSYTCKIIQYKKRGGDADIFLRDEFLKMLKLGMTHGYKLSFASASSNTLSGSVIIIYNLRNVSIKTI